MKMDLSSFSTDDFEPVNWINGSFKKSEDKEKFASDSVLKLQLFIQGINKSLESSSKKIITNLDQVKSELKTLNDHAFSLKSDLDNVQSELSKIQIENNGPTLNKLLEINELKNRMQETSVSLKEADNWSTLSKEMESIIQTNDLDSIATKLICMQKSLKILTNVPDYLDRVKKLNEFKSTFIQAINPKISFLFSTNSKTLELEKYIQIFDSLDKLDSLKEIHQESVIHQLILEWQKTKNLSLKDTIIDCLNSYFDHLNLVLINQIKIVALFTSDESECCDLLVKLFIDLFNRINDDLTTNLLDFIELKKEQNLISDLIHSLILTKTLLDKLNKNIYNNLIKLNPNLNDNNQSRQLFLLLNTLYRQVLKRYFTIEQEMVRNQLNEVENIQLTEYVTKIFQIQRDCEKRCYLLTNSVYFVKFINLIELNFDQSINYFQRLVNSIKVTDNQTTLDWNLFQQSLFYLQTIGDFMVQFDCFQQQIFNSWLDLKNRTSNCESIVQDFSSLYLSLNDQQILNSINIDRCDQLFANCSSKLKQLCNEILELVLSIPIAFVNGHLDQIEVTFRQHNYFSSVRNENEEVFKLSLTPNEYITQIGQYLLTIPQHIEHFIIQENIGLKCVFKHFDQTKYLGTNNLNTDDVAEFFLNVLIEKIVQLFIEKIQQLNLSSKKDQLHLVVDIEYLNEVIDDLGLSSHKSLNNLIANLK